MSPKPILIIFAVNWLQLVALLGYVHVLSCQHTAAAQCRASAATRVPSVKDRRTCDLRSRVSLRLTMKLQAEGANRHTPECRVGSHDGS